MKLVGVTIYQARPDRSDHLRSDLLAAGSRPFCLVSPTASGLGFVRENVRKNAPSQVADPVESYGDTS